MNNYDIKYIIKKILIYSGVALILMFVKSCDIKAIENYSLQWGTISCPGGQGNSGSEWKSCQNTTDNYFIFTNDGRVPEGYYDVSFTIQSSIGQNIAVQFRDVSCSVNGTDVARIGTDTYSTSGLFYTVKCDNVPIIIGNNQLYVKSYSLGTLQTSVLIYNKLTPHGADTSGIESGVDSVNNNVSDIKDAINNDNVDNQQSSDFFNNFGSTTNEGLQDLIKKPIGIINSFYNTCSPITFDIPYFDTTITLPCISSIQNDFTSVIFPIIRVIINGLLCYRILTKFIDVINKLKDPNNSDLEVVDL